MITCLLTPQTRFQVIRKSDIHIRPSEKTTVAVAFVLAALNKLDSVKQELGTTFLLHMTWRDPRLTWIPNNQSPDSFVVYVNEIWTPPLIVSNAVENSIFLLRDDIFPMRVNSSGTVTWIPRVSPTTKCEVDTSFFPLDIQICDISITSWVHSTNELSLQKGTTPHYPDPVTLDFYSDDKAWELIKTSVDIANLTGGYGMEYHQVNYRFYFKRHERFHWVLLVTPGICLAFLQPFVFLIPLNAHGPRLSYATAMLLSFILYSRVLTGIFPPIMSTDKTHLLGESFNNVMICGTFITGFVILEIIVTSFVRKKHPKDKCGTGLICLRGLEDCKICKILQLANCIICVVFFIMYITGIAVFLSHLREGDSPSANLS